MGAEQEPVRSVGVATVPAGVHACGFYRDEAEQRRMLASFVQAALAAGDQVLYVAGEQPAAASIAGLEQAGADVALPLESGQLVVRRAHELYGDGGSAALRTVLEYFGEAARSSLAEGFPALRIASDLSGFLHRIGDLDDLVGWEERAGSMQAEIGSTTLCEYDRRPLEEQEVERLVHVHQAVAVEQAVAPLARFYAQREPWGLKISGELDVSNTPQLARTIRARAALRDQLTLDLDALAFMDVGSLQTIYGIAREHRVRVTLAKVPVQIRRLIRLANVREPWVEIDE